MVRSEPSRGCAVTRASLAPANRASSQRNQSAERESGGWGQGGCWPRSEQQTKLVVVVMVMVVLDDVVGWWW